MNAQGALKGTLAVTEQQKSVLGARAISLRLRKSIERGAFSDGEQLPTERELAESYAASRSTIRNALNILEEEGFLERKVGSGTYVTYAGRTEDPVGDVVDQISPIQLIDARIGMERQITRLAVIHATRRDLETMESILVRMIKSDKDRDEFSRWDGEFHLHLAKSTGNPLMVHLYEKINEIRTHSQWNAMKNLILSQAQIQKYNEHHSGILEGIRNRDTAGAIDALNLHMELARQDLIGAEDRL
ncbi:MAG: FadR/GntR family transcriptional regulator [Pseudomonadota bacterium]